MACLDGGYVALVVDFVQLFSGFRFHRLGE